MIKQELKDRVIAWAEARNFFGEGGATVDGQLAKLLEEASELVTDIVRGRDATDSVGDCLVVLTILERMGYRVRWGEWPGRRRAVESAASFAGDAALCFVSVTGISSCDLMDVTTLLSIDPNTALEHALREIEPRRGSWSGGVFVKETQS